MTTPMRRLAAMIFAATLPASPATAHTGSPLTRVAGPAGYATTSPASASDVTSSRPGIAGRDLMSRTMEGAHVGTATTTATASGSLTLAVRPLAGRDAIVLDGTAPAALPVTFTLVGTISRDIPDVTLRRVTIATDGTFHATLDVAPTMPRGSVVTVTATSLPGVSPATARFIVGAPNPNTYSDIYDAT